MKVAIVYGAVSVEAPPPDEQDALVQVHAVSGALARLGRRLLVEFVPKSDSQVARLLVTREDIFDRYTREEFERAFSGPFEIVRHVPLAGSERALYVMSRKG